MSKAKNIKFMTNDVMANFNLNFSYSLNLSLVFNRTTMTATRHVLILLLSKNIQFQD